MKLETFASVLREAGVRKASFGPIRALSLEIAQDGEGKPVFCSFEALEFEPAHDTIPAPSQFDIPDLEPPEAKPAGTCAFGGCQERAGFHFAPRLCERHGLGEFGVKT